LFKPEAAASALLELGFKKDPPTVFTLVPALMPIDSNVLGTTGVVPTAVVVVVGIVEG